MKENKQLIIHADFSMENRNGDRVSIKNDQNSNLVCNVNSTCLPIFPFSYLKKLYKNRSTTKSLHQDILFYLNNTHVLTSSDGSIAIHKPIIVFRLLLKSIFS